MDVIERIALAMINSDRAAGGWPPLETRDDVLNSDGYVRCAEIAYRLAFAHIAENTPTKAMLTAGMDAARDAMDSDYDSDADGNRESYSYLRSDAPHMIWKAMITAMLAEKEPK